MHAATVRPKIYTVGIMTHVRAEMDAAVSAQAKAAGMTKGEWVRSVIHDRLQRGSEIRVALGEVVALRAIVMTLAKAYGVDDEQLKSLAKQADQIKESRVDALLALVAV